MDHALFGRRSALRPLPALLGFSEGARNTFHARRHCALLRRLLLHPRQQVGNRQPLVLWRSGGFWPDPRNRPAARKGRADAFGEMETALLSHQVVRRRDPIGGYWPRRAHPDAAATGAR